MIRRGSLIFSTLVLGCLSVAAGASAAAIHDQRAVGGDDLARKADLDVEAGRPLVAPPAACPGQRSLTATSEAQEAAMLCMVNHARLAYGLAPLAEDPSLGGSAERKSGDILACDDFSHFACGREFTHWMAETGYLSQNCWWVGENIAWGRGVEGTPREIFGALMRSQTHRENILGGYEQVGIDSRAGSLGFLGPVRVWTQHFGTTRCSATPAS